MGPLVSEEQLHRVTNYMNQGKQAGACYVTGGERNGRSRLFCRADRHHGRHSENEHCARGDFWAGGGGRAVHRSLRLIPRANDTNYGLAAGRLDAGHQQGPSHRQRS